MIRLLSIFTLLAVLSAPLDAGVRKMGWENTRDQDHDASPSCSALPDQNTLVVSFIAPPGVTDLETITAYVDLCTKPYALPPWWIFEPFTGCRSNALSVSADFSGGPYSFPNPWGGNAIASHVYGPGPTPDWSMARISVTVDKTYGLPAALTEGEEYYAFKIVFDNPDVGCEGCDYGACFVLNGLLLYHDGTVTPTEMDGSSNYVRWQGGQFDCPFIVATERGTWGRVKATYR